ncbi:MAG: hypothetical protein BJ554DRAFT_13 [Olpidium bornovanus]|uniref:Uncharacterized protein n=1 Tax=Olpidium bornovanus TaxID=278681 RepID=A0A8H7ZV21_9FUNG|nr:MAG: hypothetical protein BJ554DRAFT_13 [Olpidium bornovanus]
MAKRNETLSQGRVISAAGFPRPAAHTGVASTPLSVSVFSYPPGWPSHAALARSCVRTRRMRPRPSVIFSKNQHPTKAPGGRKGARQSFSSWWSRLWLSSLFRMFRGI